MQTFQSIRGRQLAVALGLLALLLLVPMTPVATASVRAGSVVCVSPCDLAEQAIEELGRVDRMAHMVVPAPGSGRLRVREADRLGPCRLHLPPPAMHLG
jgi:hypothetical protein